MSIALKTVKPIGDQEGRRVKLLLLSAYASDEIQADVRAVLTACGVPEDVNVVEARVDHVQGRVLVVLTHAGYQLVPWGAEPPLSRPGDAALIPNT